LVDLNPRIDFELDCLFLFVLPRTNSINTIEHQYREPLVIDRNNSDEEREERLKEMNLTLLGIGWGLKTKNPL
jgi:hypothetical protein